MECRAALNHAGHSPEIIVTQDAFRPSIVSLTKYAHLDKKLFEEAGFCPVFQQQERIAQPKQETSQFNGYSQRTHGPTSHSLDSAP
jgi:hypothetical protein